MVTEAMINIQPALRWMLSKACQKVIPRHLLFYNISDLSRFCYKFLGHSCSESDPLVSNLYYYCSCPFCYSFSLASP